MFKLYLNKLILLIILVFIIKTAMAQQHQIGFSVGYGAVYIGDRNELSLLNLKESNFVLAGLNYYYQPKHSIFRVKTGANYYFREYKNQEFNYAVVPCGLDFVFGKKFNFIIGFGIQFSYLLTHKNILYPVEFNETHSNFQLKREVNIGLGYDINKDFKINLNYQCNADMISMYSVKTYSVSGAVSDTPINGLENYVELTFIITINSFSDGKKNNINSN